MAINFGKDGRRVILEYISKQHDASWINEKLNDHDNHTFYNTFTVSRKDLLPIDETDKEYNVRRFVIGKMSGGYQCIDKKVMGLKHDLLISDSVNLQKKLFVAKRDISIFRRIDALINEQIVI